MQDLINSGFVGLDQEEVVQYKLKLEKYAMQLQEQTTVNSQDVMKVFVEIRRSFLNDDSKFILFPKKTTEQTDDGIKKSN